MITNQEKEATYKILKVKLNVALRNEFWFEACMIEYAIIEDRTSSILEHSGVCKNAYDESKKLSNKLNSIEHQIGKGHPIISRKVKKNHRANQSMERQAKRCSSQSLYQHLQQ